MKKWQKRARRRRAPTAAAQKQAWSYLLLARPGPVYGVTPWTAADKADFRAYLESLERSSPCENAAEATDTPNGTIRSRSQGE